LLLNSVYCYKRIFRYRLSPETFAYTLVDESAFSVGTFSRCTSHQWWLRILSVVLQLSEVCCGRRDPLAPHKTNRSDSRSGNIGGRDKPQWNHRGKRFGITRGLTCRSGWHRTGAEGCQTEEKSTWRLGLVTPSALLQCECMAEHAHWEAVQWMPHTQFIVCA